MNQAEPVEPVEPVESVGSIQNVHEKPKVTMIRHTWKNLNIRVIFDVKGKPLGLKNTGIVCLNMLWVILLMLLFVICGTLNTILYKYQNESYSKGPGSGPPVLYAHPFSQGIQMFLGMIFFCLPLHWLKENLERCGVMDKIFPKKKETSVEEKRRLKEGAPKKRHRAITFLPDDDYLGSPMPDTPVPEGTYGGIPQATYTGYEQVGEDSDEEGEGEGEKKEKKKDDGKLPPINQLLFLIPAACDLIASTFLYIGLILTYASVYQMLRSTVVVFTAILSVVFLKADIWKYPHHWVGVTLIIIGTAIVGYSSIADEGTGKAAAINPALGGLMVVIAQLVYAVQFIFEETFLKGYDTDPLQVPGYEGYWGFSLEMMILFIIYWIPGNDYGSIENFMAGIMQAFSNPVLIITILLLICNIGIYNFTGNWITRELSAATRTTIDCIRNVLVWVIQMAQGYQNFSWMQLVGFLILVSGTWVYNQVGFNIVCPCYQRRMKVWKKCSVKDCLFGKKDDEEEDKNKENEGETGEWTKGEDEDAVRIAYYNAQDDGIEEPHPMEIPEDD